MLPKRTDAPALNDALEGLRNSRKPKPVTLGRMCLRFGVGVLGMALAWGLCLAVFVGVLSAARLALAIVGWR